MSRWRRALLALVRERYEAPLIVVYEWPDALPANAEDTILVPALEAIERLARWVGGQGARAAAHRRQGRLTVRRPGEQSKGQCE
jgi:hypothetical protein